MFLFHFDKTDHERSDFRRQTIKTTVASPWLCQFELFSRYFFKKRQSNFAREKIFRFMILVQTFQKRHQASQDSVISTASQRRTLPACWQLTMLYQMCRAIYKYWFYQIIWWQRFKVIVLDAVTKSACTEVRFEQSLEGREARDKGFRPVKVTDWHYKHKVKVFVWRNAQGGKGHVRGIFTPCNTDVFKKMHLI